MTLYIHHRPDRRTVQIIEHGVNGARRIISEIAADAADELAVDLLSAALLVREGTGRRMTDQVKSDILAMLGEKKC